MRYGIILIALILIGCSTKKILQNGDMILKINQSTIIGSKGEKLTLDEGAKTKTFYLVRHAEKDTFPKRNPVLNEAGYSRSYRLAQIFKQTRIDKVYSTLYTRTMHTVDSLVTSKGISTNIYSPKEMKELSQKLVASTEDNKVLIVGHSNTIPGMVNLLLGRKEITESIDESVYDNFYIVDIPEGGEPKLYSLRY